jgi:hypothetical protein
MFRINLGRRSQAVGLTALAVAISGISHAQQPPPVPGRAGQAAPGQEFELSFSLGGAWSDNINRQPELEDEGTIGQAGVQLGYSQQSRRLTTDINANVVYEHYFDGVFDDDVVGGADGLLILGIVPERFEWFVQETFGQITSDPFSSNTPENRENINYFTTGPDFTFGLGGAASMRLSGRYSSTTYEVTDLDGERYSGTAALIYQLTGNSALSLNVTGEEIKFDDQSTNADYDQQQAFLRYEAQGARTGLSVDVGHTSIEGDTTDADGLLARLALSRRLSTSSILTLSAGTQFSDSGDLFRATQGGRGPTRETQSVIGTSDPFENRFAALNWDFDRNRTGFGFGAMHSEEEYENFTDLNRTITTYNAYISRELSRALDARLFGLLEKEEFDETGFQDDEVRGGISLGWTVAQSIQLRLQVERYDRDSTAEATEYTENRASLFLVWSPVTSP